ncbi:hypothetical protein CL620_00235, partial [archaeon]|nr:hypothetical protein [archaeon]
GYQRGPVHIGKIMINYRVYGWTDEQVAKYKKMKEKETLMLFGNVSASVQEAMSALGDDLTIYLEQARSQRTRNPVIDEKKEVKAKPKKSITEKLLGDFYTPSHKKSKEPKVDKKMVQKEMADAIKAKGMLFNSKGEPQGLTKYAMSMCWPAYHNFKKSQRLITW